MNLWRKIGLIFLGLMLLLILLIGFASTWLRLGLNLAAADDITFTSFEIGLHRTEMRDLRIGDPASQTVDLIRMDHSLGGLIRGHVDRIIIAGLNATIALDDLTSDHPKQTPPLLPAGTLIDNFVLEDSRLELLMPSGSLSIPLAGHVKSEADQIDFQLTSEGAYLGKPEHGIRADLAIDGRLSQGNAPIQERLTASGHMAFQASDASIDDVIEGLDGDGLVAFEIRDGEFTASTDRLSAALAQLPFDAGPLKAPWEARFGRDDHPLQLTGRWDDGVWHVDFSGPIFLTTTPGMLSTVLDLDMTLDDEGRFQSLEQGVVSLDIEGLATNDIALSSGKAHLTMEGDKEALQGRLTLDLEGFHGSMSPHAIEDVTFEQALALTFDGRVFDLSVAERGRVSVGKLRALDQIESGWFTAHLDPNETPLFSYDVEDGRWHVTLDGEIDPVRLETPSGQWWARVEDLQFATAGDLQGLNSAELSIERGRADLPSANLALTGIESQLQLAADGFFADRTVPLTVRVIRPLDEPKWFTPLRLDATFSPSPTHLPFKGKLAARKAPAATVDFSGSHRLENGEGVLDFELPKLAFAPDGLQPADFSPPLQDVLSDTAGRMALAGQISWSPDGLSSAADLLIEELGLTIGPARLERVNSLLHFDNLLPPTMTKRQELAIALLDVGLPLTDGLVSMTLDANGKLAVDRLAWRFADGGIRARPFTFGSDVEALTMVLDVDRLDLDGLFQLIGLDGLSGEGQLDGILPLTVSETGAVVADGKLKATGPGILRYKPGGAPGALQAGGVSVGLMLQALENFHYDELEITLDGRTDGDADIGLHIRGANPDLYEGHPIEFNLDLEGDLADLISANISNYQIPDRIRERLQGFGQ